ncbi:MAG: SUMF1/EgtB/PvdO family nonheme iron enzyme [Fibrobacter sp.]|nr:SUMF1/EgtB/PvdO family nonheme iron enzyme [Fibrobacter sp.]
MRIRLLFVLLFNCFIACEYDNQEQVCEFVPRQMAAVESTVIVNPWILIRCVEKGEMCRCLGTDTTRMFDTIKVGSFMIDTEWTTSSNFNALISGSIPYNAELKSKCDNTPATLLNMYEAIVYCNMRSKHEGFDTVYSYTRLYVLGTSTTALEGLNTDTTKNGYRLPSRWEFEAAFQCGFIKKESDEYGGWTADYYDLPAVVETNPCNPYYTRTPVQKIDQPYIWPLGFPVHSYNRGDSKIRFTVVRSVF